MDWQKASAELVKPLDPAKVKARKQGGTNVSYVEAFHVIAEANRIFGHDGWTRETLDLRCIAEREAVIGEYKKPGWRVTYIARVRVVAGGVTREGSGAGHGIGVDLGEMHESALKEAETDAMKRALMTFGWTFGLALYDKSRENVGAPEPETPATPPPSADPPDAIAAWLRRQQTNAPTLDAFEKVIGAQKYREKLTALHDANPQLAKDVVADGIKRRAALTPHSLPPGLAAFDEPELPGAFR